MTNQSKTIVFNVRLICHNNTINDDNNILILHTIIKQTIQYAVEPLFYDMTSDMRKRSLLRLERESLNGGNILIQHTDMLN